MLQVFRMDVVKVDRDVAYVARVVHVCCKRLFPMFHLFFQMYVASVFIWMLYTFHTYIASVLSRCCVCLQWFSSVSGVFFKCFQTHISSVSSFFRRMLQVLHLDVSKVDRVLHILQRDPTATAAGGGARGAAWGQAVRGVQRGNEVQMWASERPGRKHCRIQHSFPEDPGLEE
jgi:hypothetical protein